MGQLQKSNQIMYFLLKGLVATTQFLLSLQQPLGQNL